MEMSMNKINFLSYVEERTVLVVKVAQSCPTLRPHGLYSPWNSPSQNTGVGSLSLLQWIFPTQGLNPGLSHCRRILYQPRRKGSPASLCWGKLAFSLLPCKSGSVCSHSFLSMQHCSLHSELILLILQISFEALFFFQASLS